MKKVIQIKFQNGISYLSAIETILNDLLEEYEFIENINKPDYILYGPYGNDIPPQGDYIRIGYFCENVKPDMSVCEWAFGVPHEKEVNHPNYKRIQWHGLNPTVLIKDLTENAIDKVISEKKLFCNFLYSHRVPYREEFFKQISKYKKVDAPGRSMNNMASIDSTYTGDIWDRKRKFLSQYKFTIAFENYSYPGYQTEKLYDAMQMNSIPIYCGDPYISEIFNHRSFINTHDFVQCNSTPFTKWLEKNSQMDFEDIRPQFYKSPYHQIKRKLKAFGREQKMRLQFNKLNFSNVIDKIIEIDKNPQLYIDYLKEPWFKNNILPQHTSTRSRWIEIFN